MTDEQQVRALIAAQNANIAARDLEKIVAIYAEDASIFDLTPPRQIEGREAIRKLWADSLPMMPANFKMDIDKVHIKVMGEAAVAHWTQTFSCQPGHPANGMKMRVTVVCQKQDGHWMSVHEHVSTPMQAS